jgi:hypothetical protein
MFRIGQRAQDPVSGRVGVVAALYPDYVLCYVPGQPRARFRLSVHARRSVIKPYFQLGQTVEYYRRTPGRTNNRTICLRAIVVNARPIKIRIDQPDQPLYHGNVFHVYQPQKRLRAIA